MIKSIQQRMTVVSTPRSGHHAVANWVLRQHDGMRCLLTGISRNPAPIRPSEIPYANEYWWYEGDDRAYRDNNRITDENGQPRSGPGMDLSVVLDCYERETVEEMRRYYRDCPTTMIVVVRNVFNTIASMIRRRPDAPFFRMNVWKSVASQALNGSRDGITPILFDQWHADKQYRASVARQLGVNFTDAGRNEVLNIGRGSSYDMVDFDGRAEEMDVLRRHEDIVDNPVVIEKVMSDPEALEMNEALFGSFMPPGSQGDTGQG